MPDIIKVKRRKEIRIKRNTYGEGVIKIDSDAADVLEKMLSEFCGDLSVKSLASSMIKYAANDTIISMEDEEDG